MRCSPGGQGDRGRSVYRVVVDLAAMSCKDLVQSIIKHRGEQASASVPQPSWGAELARRGKQRASAPARRPQRQRHASQRLIDHRSGRPSGVAGTTWEQRLMSTTPEPQEGRRAKLRINTTRSQAERGLDAYFTPPQAVWSLLALETVPHCIWEPAAGDGAIVRVLEAAGHPVIASDIADYGAGYPLADYLTRAGSAGHPRAR